jgi:hypothetical protein
LLAPIGLSAIGYAVSGRDRDVLQRLSRVPDIDRLINEANTEAEKIRLLKEDRARILQTVQLEAQREALVQQRDRLERDGVRILGDLEIVERELIRVRQAVQVSPAAAEIERLFDRLRARRRGDIVIRLGNRDVVLDLSILASLPGASLFVPYFRLLGYLTEVLTRMRTSHTSSNKRPAPDA